MAETAYGNWKKFLYKKINNKRIAIACNAISMTLCQYNGASFDFTFWV